jgi:hypothetical protein
MRKTKILHVRLTESQFEKLTETLIYEQMNQSELIRQIIEKYTRFYRVKRKKIVAQLIEQNKVLNIKKSNYEKKY